MVINIFYIHGQFLLHILYIFCIHEKHYLYRHLTFFKRFVNTVFKSFLSSVFCNIFIRIYGTINNSKKNKNVNKKRKKRKKKRGRGSHAPGPTHLALAFMLELPSSRVKLDIGVPDKPIELPEESSGWAGLPSCCSVLIILFSFIFSFSHFQVLVISSVFHVS